MNDPDLKAGQRPGHALTVAGGAPDVAKGMDWDSVNPFWVENVYADAVPWSSWVVPAPASSSVRLRSVVKGDE